VSRFFQMATKLDQIGLRRPLAWLASRFYSERHFEVDLQLRWVNRQHEATIVSPNLHVTRYAEVRAWVLDNWCYDYIPTEGDTVIDVGAGIGEETLIFSHLVGKTGRVISIEAHPDTFSCLKETIRCSGLTNVTAVQCAIADKDGQIFMNTANCHVASSVMVGGDIMVSARSLDSLATQLGLGSIAFIKMNIEGAEKLAIKGMTTLFPRISNQCISCHDFIAELGGNDSFRSKVEIRAALEDKQYRIRTRPDHTQIWVRDYIYASRESL
jgi:FkbM family methyltransferase